MNELRKKPRKMRVERMTRSDNAMHGEESWAISYADMLMVLLAFFVVFFSIDNKSEKDDLIDIISGKKAPAGVADKKGVKPDVVTIRVGDKVGDVLEGLKGVQAFVSTLKGFDAETRVEGRKLILHFPANIYPPGKYVLGGESMKSLDEVIARLKPLQEGIEVSFVGHTDEQKLRNRKNRTLANNFDLSSLRASRALQRAIELGIKPATLSAQGGAEYSRNSRSLTVVVSMKRESP